MKRIILIALFLVLVLLGFEHRDTQALMPFPTSPWVVFNLDTVHFQHKVEIPYGMMDTLLVRDSARIANIVIDLLKAFRIEADTQAAYSGDTVRHIDYELYEKTIFQHMAILVDSLLAVRMCRVESLGVDTTTGRDTFYVINYGVFDSMFAASWAIYRDSLLFNYGRDVSGGAMQIGQGGPFFSQDHYASLCSLYTLGGQWNSWRRLYLGNLGAKEDSAGYGLFMHADTLWLHTRKNDGSDDTLIAVEPK